MLYRTQVALTFNNGAVKGYVNADLESSSTPATGSLSYVSNNNVNIGLNNGSYFDGEIAIVKVYNTALTTTLLQEQVYQSIENNNNGVKGAVINNPELILRRHSSYLYSKVDQR